MSRGSEVVYVVSGSCQGESELEREMTRHTPQQPRDLLSLSVFQTAPRRTRGVYRIILYRSCHEQQSPLDDNNGPMASSTLLLPGSLRPMFWWHHEKLQRKSQRRAALRRNRVEERDIAQQQRLITWFGARLRSLCQHERAIENLIWSRFADTKRRSSESPKLCKLTEPQVTAATRAASQKPGLPYIIAVR